MIQWEKLLRSLGFSDSESKIYLVSLEAGPSAVQDLAKKAKVSRVTAYAVIESLINDGLMSTMQKGKKKLFLAESPERLLSFVQSKMKGMEATLREMESVIGDLRLLQRGEKPVVKLFEGPEALKAIQDDVLRSRPKQIDEFGNLDDVARLHPSEKYEPFYSELAKLKPKKRLVFLAKEKKPVSRFAEDRILTLPESFDFHGDITVYENKIAMSTLGGKQISVLIESKELADTLRSVFDLIWKDKEQK